MTIQIDNKKIYIKLSLSRLLSFNSIGIVMTKPYIDFLSTRHKYKLRCVHDIHWNISERANIHNFHNGSSMYVESTLGYICGPLTSPEYSERSPACDREEFASNARAADRCQCPGCSCWSLLLRWSADCCASLKPAPQPRNCAYEQKTQPCKSL